MLSNAWKFTSNRDATMIEVGVAEEDDLSVTFFVGANGAGFDPAREEEVFQAFKRLHSSREFPGNGVGLSTVKRIVIAIAEKQNIKVAVIYGLQGGALPPGEEIDSELV